MSKKISTKKISKIESDEEVIDSDNSETPDVSDDKMVSMEQTAENVECLLNEKIIKYNG